MQPTNINSQGVLLSICASVMYGIIPWYITQFSSLDGTGLFYCRVALLFLCLAGLFIGKRNVDQLTTILRQRRLLMMLLLCGLLNGSQWWLFVWAPVNGFTKELSLGFFLLPLTMALAGRCFLKEALSRPQRFAIAVAAIGVTFELWLQGSLSWVTLSPALVFPLYFLLRRRIPVSAPAGLLIESALFMPLALYGLGTSPSFITSLTEPSFLLWLVGFAMLTSGSMLSYLGAARRLPISLFGLLSYLEPTLLLIVAIVILQEPIATGQLLSYGLIILATAIVIADTTKQLLQQRRRQQALAATHD